MKRRKHQKFRSRGGIRLPAAITLCLALSLLIFSRAGGEPIAQKGTDRSGAQQRLCHPRNGARIRCFAGGYRRGVHAAHGCRSADEQAENPLAESTYVPLVRHRERQSGAVGR